MLCAKVSKHYGWDAWEGQHASDMLPDRRHPLWWLLPRLRSCRLYIYQFSIWRYGSTLSGTLSLLFSPSGTKALMRQFVADAPKAHESLSTEARRVPVQGTPIPLISVFIASFCFGTIWNDLFFTKIEENKNYSYSSRRLENIVEYINM